MASVSARARMCSASVVALSSWLRSAAWASGVLVPLGVRRQTTTKREHHREQPDYHERERQSAAHGHPSPSRALGAPLCCNYPGTRDLCPGADGRTPRRPSADLPVSFDYITYPLATPPLSSCAAWEQHLAAVRLRVYNLFIKQCPIDLAGGAPARERCDACWLPGWPGPSAALAALAMIARLRDWAALPDCCGRPRTASVTASGVSEPASRAGASARAAARPGPPASACAGGRARPGAALAAHVAWMRVHAAGARCRPACCRSEAAARPGGQTPITLTPSVP